MRPEEEFQRHSVLETIKFFVQGALFAFLWASLFIIGGAVWSVFNLQELSIFDHVFNGWVIAQWANFLSIILGCSIGLYALLEIGENTQKNLKILGFVLTHFIIVFVIWNSGLHDLRKSYADKNVIEKVRDFKWPNGTNNYFE